MVPSYQLQPVEVREEAEKKETKKYQNRAAQAREDIREAKLRIQMYPARESTLFCCYIC